MINEQHEYKVQELPLERMQCVRKNLEQTSTSHTTTPRGCYAAVLTGALITVLSTVITNHRCCQ
jgi:hypothetical protein